MSELLSALAILAWWSIGFGAIVWELTRSQDMSLNDTIIGAVFALLLGPCIVVIIALIHLMFYQPKKPTIVFKRRRR